jgi:Cytochrome P460
VGVALVLTRAAVLLVALALAGVATGQSAVVFPREYKTTLVKYAVVDRGDGMSRDLYVSPEAVEALRRDPALAEFPVGVVFAIDVYSARAIGRDFERTLAGRLVRSKDERTLHLMRRITPGFGSQHWAFAGFDPLTGEPLKLELPGDCLRCHQEAVVSDMAFSAKLLRRFVAGGEVQYRFCPHPGRQSCPLQ